jgi:hypothetical protein
MDLSAVDLVPTEPTWLPQSGEPSSWYKPEPALACCWLPPPVQVCEFFLSPAVEISPWFSELAADPGASDIALAGEESTFPLIDPLTGIDEQNFVDELSYFGLFPAEEGMADDLVPEESASEWPLYISFSLIITNHFFPIYTDCTAFVEEDPVLTLDGGSEFIDPASWFGDLLPWESPPWLGEGGSLEPLPADPYLAVDDPLLIVCPPLEGPGKEPCDPPEEFTYLPVEFPPVEASQEAPSESPPEAAVDGESLLEPIRSIKPYFRGVAISGDLIDLPVFLAEPDPILWNIAGSGSIPDLHIQNPSGSDPLAEYISFLAGNPHWLESHRIGDFELQVVTPSAFLPSIELGTPSAARAFDVWYALIQPPSDAPPVSENAEPPLPALDPVICFPDGLPTTPPPSAADPEPGPPPPLPEPKLASELPLPDPVLPALKNLDASSPAESSPVIVLGSEFLAQPLADSAVAPTAHPPLDPVVDVADPILGSDFPPPGEVDLLLMRRSRAPLPEDLALLPAV